MYDFEYADEHYFEYLKEYDSHISLEMLSRKIKDREIIIAKTKEKITGWLRYGYFWDNIPFINMIIIDKQYRGKGIGKDLVGFWEREMSNKGYKIVVTSTLSNESAQHFYRKLGYRDSGSLILENEALEIIFTKNL